MLRAFVPWARVAEQGDLGTSLRQGISAPATALFEVRRGDVPGGRRAEGLGFGFGGGGGGGSIRPHGLVLQVSGLGLGFSVQGLGFRA